MRAKLQNTEVPCIIAITADNVLLFTEVQPNRSSKLAKADGEYRTLLFVSALNLCPYCLHQLGFSSSRLDYNQSDRLDEFGGACVLKVW